MCVSSWAMKIRSFRATARIPQPTDHIWCSPPSTPPPKRLLIAVALLDSTVKVFYENSLRFFLRYKQHQTRASRILVVSTVHDTHEASLFLSICMYKDTYTYIYPHPRASDDHNLYNPHPACMATSCPSWGWTSRTTTSSSPRPRRTRRSRSGASTSGTATGRDELH